MYKKTVSLLLIALAACYRMPPSIYVLALVFSASALYCIWKRPVSTACTLQWPQAGDSPRQYRFWLLLSLVLLSATLAGLEYRQPYYFTQDDNHSQFLPILLEAMDGLFTTGIFPTWNAYQGMGLTTVEGGAYSLTYPPAHLAYLLASAAGNTLLTIEIYAWMHLLAACALLFYVLRKMRVQADLASAAALAFTLCGYLLISGRSWYILLPTATYLPGLLYSLYHAYTQRSFSNRWAIYTALNHAAWFYAGHPQFWLYGMCFWGLGVIAIWQARCERKFDAAIAITGCGLLLAGMILPLAYINFLRVYNFDRPRWVFGAGLLEVLHNLLLPWPLSNGDMLKISAHLQPFHAAAFYINSIFLLSFIAACWCWLVKTARGDKNNTPENSVQWVLGLAAVALVWSFGNYGGLWWALSYIPPFKYMNSPHKLLPFVNFFVICSAALWLACMLEKHQVAALKRHVTAAGIIALSLYNASLCSVSRYDFAPLPYAPLPAAMRIMQYNGQNLPAGRVLAYGKSRSADENFPLALMNDYASYYSIFTANGYDDGIMRSRTNGAAFELAWRAPRQFFQEYGVRWLILRRPDPRDDDYATYSPILPDWIIAQYETSAEKTRLINLENPQAKPLAYATLGNSIIPLKYSVRPNGLTLFLPPELQHMRGLTVTANFLFREGFSASDEHGQPLALTPDDYLRMQVTPQAGSSEVILRYAPPALAAVLTCGMVIVFLGCSLLWDRKRRKIVSYPKTRK